ncbi:hypothetical protein ACFPM0_07505 [Pseudonocardia sulfidoxydans]|uniref:hypothetical protein n=1 Tax=Pseudonocardia sulfidoxydans TaxID=54011 RepID=UPI003621D53E
MPVRRPAPAERSGPRAPHHPSATPLLSTGGFTAVRLRPEDRVPGAARRRAPGLAARGPRAGCGTAGPAGARRPRTARNPTAPERAADSSQVARRVWLCAAVRRPLQATRGRERQ